MIRSKIMYNNFDVTNLGECNKLTKSILAELENSDLIDDFSRTEEEAKEDRTQMILWMVEHYLPKDIHNFDEAKKWIIDNIFELAVTYCEDFINDKVNFKVVLDA